MITLKGVMQLTLLRKLKRFLVATEIGAKTRMIFQFFLRFSFTGKNFSILRRYLKPELFEEDSDQVHLDATMEWLKYAQDHDKSDAGIANVYYFYNGWGVSYPETSGYIIPTFLAYSEKFKDKSLKDRAVAIGKWEIDIQAPDGGVYSSVVRKNIRVFNTGQVMLGWCALYEATKNREFLKAASKAGDYLCTIQETNGSWITSTHCGARTLHARVDWALLRCFEITRNPLYEISAVENLKWVLSQQTPNGWFENSQFDDELPIMHTIIYTLRGLLESHLSNSTAVKELDLLSCVKKTVDTLCDCAFDQPVDGVFGLVPRAFDRNWIGTVSDSCITGNVQFACLLFRLSHIIENEKYIKVANALISATKKTQIINTDNRNLRGAVPGTYPMYTGYVPNGYPNWAAKYLADSILMKTGLPEKLRILA